jgi:hypothetical protein
MPNPLYADDPAFYERPGETVDLPVLWHAKRHITPKLPWQAEREGAERTYFPEVSRVRDGTAGKAGEPHDADESR